MMEQLGQLYKFSYRKRTSAVIGTTSAALALGGYTGRNYNSNRRMDRCRSSKHSYNHSFLTLYLSI
jgi:hypothetical protein